MNLSSTDELVEWIDDDGTTIEVVTRSRMRAENLRHRSVAIIVMSRDGRLLVHQRSPTKDLRPAWWDIAAGGVVGAGETWIDAARRELAEEVGVRDAPLEFVTIGSYDDVDSRELCHLYRAVHDGPYEFTDGEVAQARLVTPAEFTDLTAHEPFLPGSITMLLPHVPGFHATPPHRDER